MSNKNQINEGVVPPPMYPLPHGGTVYKKGANIPPPQAIPAKPQNAAPVAPPAAATTPGSSKEN